MEHLHRLSERIHSAVSAKSNADGEDERFGSSKKAIEKSGFTYGNGRSGNGGYVIGEDCIGCGTCREKCPVGCIVMDDIPYEIDQSRCLRCGSCIKVCPVKAISKI